MGGNPCSFINETETVYTHRGPGPDFIWSGPATCSMPHGTTPWRKLSFRSRAVTQCGTWDPSGLSWPWASSKDLPHHRDRPWWPSPGCIWTPKDLYQGKHGPFGKLAAQECPCLSISVALQHYEILGILAGFIHPTHAWLQKTACSQASDSRGYTDDLCCNF